MMELSFEEWCDLLQEAAEEIGIVIQDLEDWRDPWEVGKWPEEALKDEFA